MIQAIPQILCTGMYLTLYQRVICVSMYLCYDINLKTIKYV